MKIMVHYYLIKYGIYMDIIIFMWINVLHDSLDKTFSVENTGLKTALGWLVGCFVLAALWDSISVYIGPSRREKEERKDRGV